MNKIKIGSVLTAFLLALSIFASKASAAEMNFEISGNGAKSDNTIEAVAQHSFQLTQTNDTNISNQVVVNNNTGGNRVSGNTSGNVDLSTGDADSTIDIVNMAGRNIAEVSACGCDQSLSAKIHGNGWNSNNHIGLEVTHEATVDQNNQTDIDNDVEVNNNTGNTSTSSSGSGQGGSYNSGYNHDYDKDHNNKNEDKKDYDHKKDYDQDQKKYDHGMSYDHDKNYGSKYGDKNKDHKHAYNHDKDYDWNRKNQKNQSYDHNKPSKKHSSYSNNWKNRMDWWDRFYGNKPHYGHGGYGGNTNGDVSLETGDATSNITILNTASENIFSMN